MLHAALLTFFGPFKKKNSSCELPIPNLKFPKLWKLPFFNDPEFFKEIIYD